MDQLKPYIGEVFDTQKGTHIFHEMSGYQPLQMGMDEWEVDTILKHRVGQQGQLEFLTKWEGSPPGEETWEPARNFISRYCYELIKYIQDHRLVVDLGKELLGGPLM